MFATRSGFVVHLQNPRLRQVRPDFVSSLYIIYRESGNTSSKGKCFTFVSDHRAAHDRMFFSLLGYTSCLLGSASTDRVLEEWHSPPTPNAVL